MRQQVKTSASALTAFAAMVLSLAPAAVSRAAGLGELQTNSALGQPFDARIDISGTADELSAAHAGIAPESAYDAAGLIRAPILDKFHVEVVTGQGAPYLRITSRQLVGEPMLQLVVDLRATGGSVRREYAVLLDPPAPVPTATQPKARATTEPADAAAAPAVTEAATISGDDTPASTSNPSKGPVHGSRKLRRAAAAPAVSGDLYGPVVPGETLGSIAEHLRQRLGGSFQSRVDALRSANPDVFEPGHPTWVRLGAMLAIPSSRLSGTTLAASTPQQVPTAALPSAAVGPVVRFQLAEQLSAPPPPASAAVTPATAAGAAVASSAATAQSPMTAVPAASQPVASPVAPVVVPTAAATRSSWFTDFRAWLLLLAIAAVAWLVIARRRQAAEPSPPIEDEDAEYTAVTTSAPRSVVPPASAVSSPATDKTDSETKTESVEDVKAPAAVETPAADVPADDVEEPVVAAATTPAPAAEPAAEPEENYHGFYGEVAQLLLGALTREPSRRDLRMKLLEVYYESREIELFHKHARLYLQSLNGQDDDQWPRIQAMGRELLPEAPLFNATSRTALALAARPLRFYEHDLADTLEPALQALAADYRELHVDVDFRDELLLMLAVIRPPGLPLAMLGDGTDESVARVWCKWERIDPVGDAAHVNAYSQAFLALRLQREALVSATRSGRHGVAVASAAAELGLSCRIHMQESDHQRETDSVKQMRALGATIIVEPDSGVAGDARTAALRDWLQAPKKSLYISSLAAGPHPYPAIVRDFQALLGAETKAQVIERFRRRPLAVVVGRSDGPSAISILQAFLDDRETALYCVDSDQGAANQSYRREHSWLQHTGRVQYLQGNDLDIDLVRKMIPAQELGVAPAGSVRAAAFALKIASQSATAGEVIVLMRREAGALATEPLDLEIEPQQTGLELNTDEPQLQPAVGRVRSRR
jgi:tryptophan synthase beta subunit